MHCFCSSDPLCTRRTNFVRKYVSQLHSKFSSIRNHSSGGGHRPQEIRHKLALRFHAFLGLSLNPEQFFSKFTFLKALKCREESPRMIPNAWKNGKGKHGQRITRPTWFFFRLQILEAMDLPKVEVSVKSKNKLLNKIKRTKLYSCLMMPENPGSLGCLDHTAQWLHP